MQSSDIDPAALGFTVIVLNKRKHLMTAFPQQGGQHFNCVLILPA